MSDQIEQPAPAPFVPSRNWVGLYFPIRLKLIQPGMEHFTGTLGATEVVDGLTGLLNYREARHLSLSWKFEELESGVYFNPITEQKLWRAVEDTNLWNGMGAVHPEVLLCEARRLEPVAEPAAAASESPPEADAAASAAEPAEAAFAPQETAAPAAATSDSRESITKALGKLRDLYGARFLRQICEARKVKADRAGDVMILHLVDSGITMAEVLELKTQDVRDQATNPNDVPVDTQSRVAGPQ